MIENAETKCPQSIVQYEGILPTEKQQQNRRNQEDMKVYCSLSVGRKHLRRKRKMSLQEESIYMEKFAETSQDCVKWKLQAS